MIEWIFKNKEWLFSGIGVTIVSFVLILIKKLIERKGRSMKNNSRKDKEVHNSGIIMGDNINNSGFIAGHDIHVHQDILKEKNDELIKLLCNRADKIRKKLNTFYKYIEVKKYLDEFIDLHNKHINALKSGNIILAHEILCDIHNLSFEIEKDEFWTRHKIETPNVHYSLRKDIFKRGILICGYIVGDLKSYSPMYPSDLYKDDDGKKVDIYEFYKFIYDSDKKKA